MIETYLLEYLVAFAKAGTLSAAAEQLHVSQPSLTRSMQKLEDLIEVPLFERTKNRLQLNEYGHFLAARAEWLLTEQKDLVDELQARYRRSQTIAVGSCAPIPSWEIQQTLSGLYPQMTISTQIQPEDSLLKGLMEDQYQLILLPRPASTSESAFLSSLGSSVVAAVLCTEKLMVSLPPVHPLAREQSLSFSDIDGMTFLQYRSVGFWFEICRKKMPNAHFLFQDDYATFMEIVSSSSLPCFSTDAMLKRTGPSDVRTDAHQRINIPLSDPEIDISYYLICKKENRARFQALFRSVRL